jgi:hypothetical protein
VTVVIDGYVPAFVQKQNQHASGKVLELIPEGNRKNSKRYLLKSIAGRSRIALTRCSERLVYSVAQNAIFSLLTSTKLDCLGLSGLVFF